MSIMLSEDGVTFVGTISTGIIKSPTEKYRWRKKLFFGKTLERAWRTVDNNRVYYTWKKVHSVKWNADGITKYA